MISWVLSMDRVQEYLFSAQIHISETFWMFIPGFIIVVNLVNLIIGSYFFPETPSYLYHSLSACPINSCKCYKIIEFLHGSNDVEIDLKISSESNSSRRSSSQSSPESLISQHNDNQRHAKEPKTLYQQLLADPTAIKIIIHVSILATSYTASGPVVFLNYSVMILKKFDLTKHQMQIASLTILLICLLGSIFGTFIYSKFKMRLVFIGSALSLALIGFVSSYLLSGHTEIPEKVQYLLLTLNAASQLIFYAGIAPMWNIVACGILPVKFSGIGMNCVTALINTVSFILLRSFPIMYVTMGSHIYDLFATVNLFYAAFYYFRGIETDGVPQDVSYQKFSKRGWL